MYTRDIPPEIAEAYLERHRHYHTLEHIYNGLRVLPLLMDEEKLDTYQQQRVIRAWWAHDVVYTPGAKDNEAASAAVANHFWKDPEIGDLIMATVYPNVTPPQDLNPSARCLVDADLLGLSQSPVIFDHHTEQVRREFVPVLYSDYEFMVGRKKFWTNLLETQVPLYKTMYAQDMWETKAFRNIRRELVNL